MGHKYSIPDDHWDDEDEDEPTNPDVYTGSHVLYINDERDEIERYNGLQWWFLFDEGVITGIDVSHYCPGPGHTDPMGFRRWDDVPAPVQAQVLTELNAESTDEVVDIEAVNDVADREREMRESHD